MDSLVKQTLDAARRFLRRHPQTPFPQLVVGFPDPQAAAKQPPLVLIDRARSAEEQFFNCAVFRAAFAMHDLRSYSIIWKSKAEIHGARRFNDWALTMAVFPAGTESEPRLLLYRQNRNLSFRKLMDVSLPEDEALLGASYRDLTDASYRQTPLELPGETRKFFAELIEVIRFDESEENPNANAGKESGSTEEKMRRLMREWFRNGGRP